jgi:hypothetical protein
MYCYYSKKLYENKRGKTDCHMILNIIIIKISTDTVESYPLASLSSDVPFEDLAGNCLFGDHLVLLSSSYHVLMKEEIC